jgi:hypothetical protein
MRDCSDPTEVSLSRYTSYFRKWSGIKPPGHVGGQNCGKAALNALFDHIS